jgi:hypothetical protein
MEEMKLFKSWESQEHMKCQPKGRENSQRFLVPGEARKTAIGIMGFTNRTNLLCILIVSHHLLVWSVREVWGLESW